MLSLILTYLAIFSPALSPPTACGQEAPQAPMATITVAAGKYTRLDTIVNLSLAEVADRLAGSEIQLQEIKGSERIPVPAQIERANPPQLWWVLSGTTPPGQNRYYQLLKSTVPPEKSQSVAVKENGSSLQVCLKGATVLQYNYATVAPPEGVSELFARSGFIHPLWSPAGEPLTAIHPPDHIHHMGIWLAWTHTRLDHDELDFWNLGKGQGNVRFAGLISTTEGPVFGGFQARHQHINLGAPPGKNIVLEEIWDVRVYNVGGPQKGFWLWDLASTQRCTADSPLQQLQYHYGGLAFRGPAHWTDPNCAYLTSEGKTRKDGHGTRARWCDMSGTAPTGWAGVTIISHPGNFRHPEPIRIWPEGQVFFNFAPSQLGNWTMEPSEPYTFRYRFYVHNGRINPADAERFWNDFADPPRVQLPISEQDTADESG